MDIAAAAQAFAELLSLIETLRGPRGCPWDREQTPLTLRRTLIEEAYELVHAIGEGRPEGLREELGDVYLNVAMIGQMLEESGVGSLAEVLRALCAKLIRRHPHVFGQARASTAEEVVLQWEQIKAQERDGRPQGLLDRVGKGLPPLERARVVQEKAAKVGFDWDGATEVLPKLREEVSELERELVGGGARERLEAEVGDLLFTVVNLSRHLGVDPSLALDAAVERFRQRFAHIEEAFRREGRELGLSQRARMEELWEEAKARWG